LEEQPEFESIGTSETTERGLMPREASLSANRFPTSDS